MIAVAYPAKRAVSAQANLFCLPDLSAIGSRQDKEKRIKKDARAVR